MFIDQVKKSIIVIFNKAKSLLLDILVLSNLWLHYNLTCLIFCVGSERKTRNSDVCFDYLFNINHFVSAREAA